MGKQTKIIATVVPTRLDAKNNALIINVFLSPRLPLSGALEDYYEVLNWPEYAEHLKAVPFSLSLFAVDYNKTAAGTYEYKPAGNGTIKPGAIKVLPLRNPVINYRFDDGTFFPSDNNGGYPFTKDDPVSNVLWGQMFSADTPVSGWITNEIDYSLAASVSREELRKSIAEAIDFTIENIISGGGYGQDHHASPSEASSFVLYLQQLKQKQPEVLLNDPLLRNNPVNNYQRGFLKALRDKIQGLYDKYNDQLKDQGIMLTAQELETRNVRETTEFHKRFSAYSNYPFLLRHTGWIWELSVDLNALKADSTDDALPILEAPTKGKLKFMKLKFPDNMKDIVTDTPEWKASKTLFYHEIDLLSPASCFEYDKSAIVFQPGNNPEFRLQYFQIEHGVITAKPAGAAQYEITPHLIDKNQLFDKLRNILTDNISKLSETNGPAEDRAFLQTVSTELNEVQSDSQGSSRANEYISNGISLNIDGLKEILANLISANPETQTADPFGGIIQSIKEGLIYSHNLHVGYRVDVAMLQDEKLIALDSLCKRKEYYCICYDKGNVWAENPIDSEEGWLMESTQGSQSGLTYVDDELFRWNDWNLVCPQIGDHEDVEKPTEEELKDPTKLNITEVPPDGTLVPLRFGYNYRFRLRVVDICGNNSGYIQGDEVYNQPIDPKDSGWTKPLLYQRLDPVNTPVIIPGHKIYSRIDLVDNDKTKRRLVWEDARFGEDLETLVIRAYYNGKLLQTEQSSIRYLGPPKANLHFVLKHRVLDEILSNTYRAEAIKNELFELADRETMPSELFYRKNQDDINYLFDPIVTGFDVIHERTRFFKQQAAYPSLQSITTPFWENWKYLMLVLERPRGPQAERAKPNPYNSDTNVKMTISVKQGAETNFLLGCMYYKDIDPIFHECVDKIKRANMKLIHAVQKPCLVDEIFPNTYNYMDDFKSLVVQDKLSRVAEKNSFTFRMFFDLFPVNTTESSILHIQYADIVSDRSTLKGYKYEQIQRVVKTGLQPGSVASEKQVSFNNLEHVFPDSHFRRVNLRMEALSAFKKYFIEPDKNNFFSVFSMEAPWDVLAKADTWNNGADAIRARAGWQLIENTNRPAPVTIDRIVPLVSWSKDKDGNRVERTADTIRIYFEGEWYSSGEEEKVAIFYLDDPNVNSTCVPIKLENVISQFGVDPAAQAQPLSDRKDIVGLLATQQMFFPAVSPVSYVADIEVNKLEFDPSPEADPQPFCEKPAIPEKVKAVIYDIHYAPPAGMTGSTAPIDSQDKLGKFYVDVKLNSKLCVDHYFPFVRFAIARYQEHSLIAAKDYRFSKITIADFVQLLPYRKLDITKDAKGLKSFTYHTPAVRKDEHAPTNKLYVFGEDNFFFNSASVMRRDDQDPLAISGAGKWHVVDKGKVTIYPNSGASAFSKYIIEEYEQYGHEDGLEDEDNPRKDFTQRLVFSYIVDL